MNDSSPSEQLEQLKIHALETLQFSKEFARHPIKKMASIPTNWDVDHSIMFQVATSAAIGLLSGIAVRSFSSAILGLILWPIATLILVFIQTFVLFHVIYFLTKQDFSFRRLYHIVAIAYTPFSLTRILNVVNIPIEILGVGFTTYLLFVGLTQDLRFPVLKMKRLVGTLFGIFAVFWIWGVAQRYQSDVSIEKRQKSDDFNKLERELTRELESELNKDK